MTSTEITDASTVLLDQLHMLLMNHPQPGDETNNELTQLFTRILSPYSDEDAKSIVAGALSVEAFTLVSLMKSSSRN